VACSQVTVALDAAGQANDRELASDVLGFLDNHQGKNATPEIFTAQHVLIIAADQSKADVPELDRPQKDRGRGRYLRHQAGLIYEPKRTLVFRTNDVCCPTAV
jgi:type IV secretion system T-DNA border endonuclease VirD2